MRSSFLVLALAAVALLALPALAQAENDQEPASVGSQLDELRPKLSEWMRSYLNQTTIPTLYKLIRSPGFQEVDTEYAALLLMDPTIRPQEAFNVLIWAPVLGQDLIAFQAVEYYLNYFKQLEDPSPLEEALAVAAIRSSVDLLRPSIESVIADELRQRLWKAVWDALVADKCGGPVSARAAHALASVTPGFYTDYDRPLIERQLPFAQHLVEDDRCPDSVTKNAAYMLKMLNYGRDNLDKWLKQGVHADISLTRYMNLIASGKLFDDRYANSPQTCQDKSTWDSNPFCAVERSARQSEAMMERVVQQSKLIFPPIPGLVDIETFSSRAFRAADTDSNGALSVTEFATFVGDKCSAESIKSALQTVYGGTRQSVERSQFFVMGNSCMDLTAKRAKAEL